LSQLGEPLQLVEEMKGAADAVGDILFYFVEIPSPFLGGILGRVI
jgi:hypothetical protein